MRVRFIYVYWNVFLKLYDEPEHVAIKRLFYFYGTKLFLEESVIRKQKNNKLLYTPLVVSFGKSVRGPSTNDA